MAPEIDAEHFRTRVLQDAIQDATAAFWRRRAALLEDARPRDGDYRGQATDGDLALRSMRLAEAAKLCRHRADISLYQDQEDE